MTQPEYFYNNINMNR